MSPRLRSRRGSALILVLVMTLAVAGLAMAAIFMSSSAGLLSRFYDRERAFRLGAESGLQFAKSLLERDTTLAIPDTGMVQIVSGMQVRNTDGTLLTEARVNVYAAVTGDTSGLYLPYVSLIATAYDDDGTRYVRRLDLRRDSFSRYAIFTHRFNSSYEFGPGELHGRVHSNATWRYQDSPDVRDTISAPGFSGSADYETGAKADTTSIVIPYPEDSTYGTLGTRASAGSLSFTPVSGTTSGATRGSRIEFVGVDADADGTVEATEGFVRIFDLAAGRDTTLLDTDINEYWYADPVIQNQCGAFYWINSASRYEFFPIATHRAAWAITRIRLSSNYPSVSSSDGGQMDDYDDRSPYEILRLPTARCFPAGSPFLMPTERFTTTGFAVSGTTADSLEWGRGGASQQYGGMDTTFTIHTRTCTREASNICAVSSIVSLGSWRAFGGTATGTVSTSIRQAIEVPYLWPLDPSRNAASRRVVHATSGPVRVSGTVAGNVTLLVSGRAMLIDHLKYVRDPNDPTNAACTDQLGLIATGNIEVVDNAITRIRVYNDYSTAITVHLGPERQFVVHGSLMSLDGTVGIQNWSRADWGSSSWPYTGCPQNVTSTAWRSRGGCFNITGGIVMADYTPLWDDAYDYEYPGMRWQGQADRCQSSARRPPFFPVTNRYRAMRAVEIEAERANTPAEIRGLLLKLKGRTVP